MGLHRQPHKHPLCGASYHYVCTYIHLPRRIQWVGHPCIRYSCVSMVLFLLDYLCPKAANTFGIEFVRFKVRDMDSQQVLFEIAKPEESDEGEAEDKAEGGETDDTERFIRYEFPPQVLRLKTLGAT